MQEEKPEVGYVKINIEFEINAPVEKTWKAFVEKPNEWWHDGFRMMTEPGTIHFEPWAGGRMYEQSENGDSLLWYNVTYIVKNSLICFQGHISPPFAGPTTNHMMISFKENEDRKTLFTVTDEMYGVVTEKLREDLENGWKMFYGESFVPYVEGK